VVGRFDRSAHKCAWLRPHASARANAASSRSRDASGPMALITRVSMLPPTPGSSGRKDAMLKDESSAALDANGGDGGASCGSEDDNIAGGVRSDGDTARHDGSGVGGSKKLAAAATTQQRPVVIFLRDRNS
jgi:hypothetical protein